MLFIDQMAIRAIQDLSMIHEQLAAAWAGIKPQNIAFLRENAYLRIIVYRIGDFSGNPSLLADDFRRAVELAPTNVIAAPRIFRIRLAIIY
jgi:hypothetical protein